MEEEISKCISLLKEGKVILYPTDTVWGIGCDATNEEALMRIYKIKQRNEKKSMIILIDSPQRLPMYVKRIPLIARDLLSREPSHHFRLRLGLQSSGKTHTRRRHHRNQNSAE